MMKINLLLFTVSMRKDLNAMTVTTGMKICICILVIILKGGLTAPLGLHFFGGGGAMRIRVWCAYLAHLF